MFLFGIEHIVTLSLLTSIFCRLLITFANSSDQDQDRQNVGSDLDPNRLTLCSDPGLTVNFEKKNSQTTTKA